MTVFVDHNRRRNLILERSFELFAQEGFTGVTYQKIADRCKISRTTIYQYFKDKEQLFLYAIKQATDKISQTAAKVTSRTDLSPLDKIRRVLHLTVKLLSENRVFLTVILDYLAIQKESGANVHRKVRRFTFGMKIFLSRLIQEAVSQNQLSVTHPEEAAAHLYCLLESYVLNLTVVDAMDWKDCLYHIETCLEKLSIHDEI
ncbi:MAG: TetR/AcrR family transcriptional regulator [Planctomycetia bacterium]|nr:TetR/AcrR family transcriptional regulator [Planctomycetia bacterium]